MPGSRWVNPFLLAMAVAAAVGCSGVRAIPTVVAPALIGRLVWEVSLPGEDLDFGVATGEINGSDPEVVVADKRGFKVFDSNGHAVGQATLNSQLGRSIVLGQLDGRADVVQFDAAWGHDVQAFDLEGKRLWVFSAGSSGIDGVATVRLDSRNTGYLIGYNGGGVELLGADGKRLWRQEVNGNVLWVTGLGGGGSSPALAVCVGPSDNALAFDLAGKVAKEFKTGEIGAVGATNLDGDGSEELLTLGTTVSSGLSLSVFNKDGSLKWSHPANGTSTAFLNRPFLFGSFGATGPLLGAADGGGLLFFKPDGTVFGTFKSKELISSAAVLHRKAKPDLIVLRLANRLRCYELGVK